MKTGRTIFKQEGYQSVQAVPYDMPIVGYGNGIVNTTLRIWDAQPVECFSLDSFDKGDYQKAVEQENLARNIVEVLYPNDNHYAGKELRLKQQYFLYFCICTGSSRQICAPIQICISSMKEVAFQLNDTHPTVAVAELMRVLMDDHDLSWDEAWKSPARPAHTPIIRSCPKRWKNGLSSCSPSASQNLSDRRRDQQKIRSAHSADVSGQSGEDPQMAIIYDGQVKMAHLAIVGGHSVNGVARLHTEIPKNRS